MARGSTVTSATYSHLLRENLKPAIRQKRRGLLTTGVFLLHDNARPHNATATVSTIEEQRFECIPHPPYSPDLAPSDFYVFGPLKDALSGKQFRDDDEVRLTVHEWMRNRPKDFFPRGIYALVKCWHKCFELAGEYVEQ
jgi:histone-lysine N-methyltransferase SETMAR